MQKTILIYDGSNDMTKEIIKKMEIIIGSAECCDVNEFKESYKKCDFFVLAAYVRKDDSLDNIMKFIINNAYWMITKKIGLLCTGSDNDEELRYLKKLTKILGNSVVHAKTIKDDRDIEKITNFSFELQKIIENFSIK